MDKEPLRLENRDEFIEENKGFIYGVVSSICNRKTQWENDDELSVGLIAFNSACNSYDDNKGNFYGYAKVIIKNSLIDYFRKNNKYKDVITFKEEEEINNYIDNMGAINQYEKEKEIAIRAEEIILFNEILFKYNLTLEDLVESSPKHLDTRNMLIDISFRCLNKQEIIENIIDKKRLPIKEITVFTGVKRKTIEKWTKYILALILVLHYDELQYMRAYLDIKVGEKHE